MVTVARRPEKYVSSHIPLSSCLTLSISYQLSALCDAVLMGGLTSLRVMEVALISTATSVQSHCPEVRTANLNCCNCFCIPYTPVRGSHLYGAGPGVRRMWTEQCGQRRNVTAMRHVHAKEGAPPAKGPQLSPDKSFCSLQGRLLGESFNTTLRIR